MDALESLDHFLSNHSIDPSRIYLTGHSMGGHGTWYLGALYPSRFAAIAPSAGWISFGTYGRRPQSDASPQLDAFAAAGMENDTLGLLRNYANLPIYILHGEKDDNVPASESHRMVAELEPFHRDFVYHEQPGAGHWWGSDCVDWPPLFDFLRRHASLLVPSHIEFVTPNPAITSTYAWVQILSQNTPMTHSSVEGDADPRRGTVELTTANVKQLKLTLEEVLTQPQATLSIDETELTVPTTEPVRLERDTDGAWRSAEQLNSWHKSAHRNGPFKLAFDRQMVWVYGTSGTAEENAALLAKVRYDSQVWWYRGNGHVSIVADQDFSPGTYQGRNIILYGNADTNTAFGKLLSDCPIQVSRGAVQLGNAVHEGDLGILFVFPRTDSDTNLIGVVGTTSVWATRQNLQARYFVSGVGVPDYVLYGRETLSAGFDGILEAGYFGNEWGFVE